MESTGEKDILDQPVSRRSLLKAAGVGIGVATVGSIVENLRGQSESVTPPIFPEPPVNAPESTISQEILHPTPTEFGFNTHLHVIEKEGENHTLETFKRSIDQLAAANQEWIRFNFMDWEVIGKGNPDLIEWTDKIEKYSEAIDYIKQKGLKIFFVTSVPAFAKDYSRENYRRTTELFYTDLATRFKGQIDVWQIFNEPDLHRFRDYQVKQDTLLTTGYPEELADIITRASKAIKAIDPYAKTTANINHWIGHHTDFKKKGAYFFDHVGEDLDLLTIDLYPDNNKDEINKLPEYVTFFQNRYNKPVIVGELGMATTGKFNQRDQGKYMSEAINSLKRGTTAPQAILLYELFDETTAGSPVENSFGFLDKNGSPKVGFEEVIPLMQPPPTEEKAE